MKDSYTTMASIIIIFLIKITATQLDNNIYSVTVIGDSSTICDGLSTTLFALGTKEGLKFLKDNYPGYECMYILDDYSPVYSSGFEDYLYN